MERVEWFMDKNYKMIQYLCKGWIDATDEEDWFQCIGVDTETFLPVDTKELIFESDLPDECWLIEAKTWEDALEIYKDKKWRVM